MKTLNTRIPCALALGLYILAVPPASVSAQTALSQPLVQAGDMRYLGSFTLPDSDGSGSDQGLLTFGGGALSVNSATQTLLLAGHDWYRRLCEVRIPALGGQATIVQQCVDITEGRLGQIDGGADTKLGGSLVWNGRVIASAYSTYDADASSRLSHFASSTNFGAQGDVLGPVQVGAAPAGFVAGYMGVVPAEWRDLLGGPALTGQCCLSIISRTSSGPSVSVFNPDDIGRVSPVPATQLLGYPLDNPLGPLTTQNNLYLRGDEMGGVAFPGGTRSVLFIGKHGQGAFCYGEAADCGDPASQYKGEHSFPYEIRVWAYDAIDLAKVRQGMMQPWQVRPYAVWQLTDISANGYSAIGGAAFDPTTGRLYVTTRYNDHPRVHVYQVGAGVVPGPGPGPGPGSALPAAPQSLTGAVQGSLVSLSWTPPAGGNYVGYVIEAGTTPGGTEVQLPVGAATTSVSAPLGPGRYYARVRAFNATPAAGPASNEVALTVGGPQAPAAQPQNFRVSVSGSQVTFTWNPPSPGDVVTTYLLDVGTRPGASDLVNGAALGAGFVLTVPNVPAGTYYVRIRAANGAGVSAPSNEAGFTVAGLSLPGAPSSFRAVVGANRLLTLSWAAPRTGGAATSYFLEVGQGPSISQLSSDVGPMTTISVPGVPVGTYYLRARARNGAGLGPPSADVRVVVR
jgi:hypothetical protein